MRDRRVKAKGKVFIITGPSGVGKGTIFREVLGQRPELAFSVSCTTRPRRPGEKEGVDYYFIGKDEFAHHVANGDFAEWTAYAEQSYGTLLSELERHTSQGQTVLVEMDVRGMRQLREALPEAVRIFIAPPSLEVLRQRLVDRRTDTLDQIESRMVIAEGEIAAQDEYNHILVNVDLEQTVQDLLGILDSE